jgi:hypothetical protein
MNSVTRIGSIPVCTAILFIGACGGGDMSTAGMSGTDTTPTATVTLTADPTETASATEADTTDGTGGSMSMSMSNSEPTTTTDPGTDTTADPDTTSPPPDTTVDPSAGPVCGDMVVDEGEECDLGAENGPFGGCSAECVINPSACGEQNFEAMLEVSPVDIIIVIDNSGSMGQEIQGVQDNINANFADIIGASGLDYRVILVAKFGEIGEESVCIEAPLGGIAAGGCDNPPGMPVNGDRFFHYDEEIASHNSLCKLIETYSEPDINGFTATGWQEWLRPEAFKTFIALTDDGVTCGSYEDNDAVNAGIDVAAEFDADLLALAPDQFGTVEERNYAWYSIVAMGYNDPPTMPWTPMDPVMNTECETAAGPGTGYQGLSVLTGALRFPLCDTTSYSVVFQAIAEGVIKGAKVACSFPIPEPPEGNTIDLNTVLVEYTVGGMGDPTVFNQVPSLADCMANSFYIDGPNVTLCPEACDLVQDDVDAKIDIAFACPPIDPG